MILIIDFDIGNIYNNNISEYKMRQRVRLTESSLRKMIKESIRQVLRENEEMGNVETLYYSSVDGYYVLVGNTADFGRTIAISDEPEMDFSSLIYDAEEDDWTDNMYTLNERDMAIFTDPRAAKIVAQWISQNNPGSVYANPQIFMK